MAQDTVRGCSVAHPFYAKEARLSVFLRRQHTDVGSTHPATWAGSLVGRQALWIL